METPPSPDGAVRVSMSGLLKKTRLSSSQGKLASGCRPLGGVRMLDCSDNQTMDVNIEWCSSLVPSRSSLYMDGLPDVEVKSTEIPRIVANLSCSGSPDFAMECLGGKVVCYRKILVAFSTVFKSIQRGVTSACLHDVSAELFAIIVRFYQSGKCSVSRKDLEPLVQVANKLGFSVLKDALEKVMKSENPRIFTVTGVVHDGLHEGDEEEPFEERVNITAEDEADSGLHFDIKSGNEDDRSADRDTSLYSGESSILGASIPLANSTAKKMQKRRWNQRELAALVKILKDMDLDVEDTATICGLIEPITQAMMARGFGGDTLRIRNKVYAMKREKSKTPKQWKKYKATFTF